MDSDSDSFFEETSDNEEVAAPLHKNLELKLEESPDLPPPSPPSPAPAPPASNPAGELSPVWELPDDGTKFMNFFTRADVLESRHWAAVTRQRRNEEVYVVEEPLLPQNFRAFLVGYHGTQWEVNFLRAASEPLFAKLLAYVAGYAKLASHNRRIFRHSFETWAVAVKLEQLRLLGESGGFLELE